MTSKRRKNLSSGFTLIELLTVISIIGFLASIVMTNVNSARAKARAAVRKQTLRQLQTALELYYEDNGSYPTTNMAWYGSGGVPSTCGTACYSRPTDYIPGLVPKYIAKLPQDPIGGYNSDSACVGWERSYLYKSNGLDYKVISMCDTTGGWTANDPLNDPKRDGNWPTMNCTVDNQPTPAPPWGWAVYTPGAAQDSSMTPPCW